MNARTGFKTSTAIKLTGKEQAMLEKAQQDGIMRGVDLLGRLTYSKWGMVKSGISAAGSIGSAAYSYHTSQHESSGSETGQGKADEYTRTEKLLGSAWQKVASEMSGNAVLSRLCQLLGTGIATVLGYIKSVILSAEVIGKAAPFVGNIKGIYDATKLAIQSHSDFKNGKMLVAMADKVAGGVPSIALEAFTTYARSEGVRCAAKAAWTYAKSIGGIIAEIFTFGAWSAVQLAVAIVEAVAGFAYSLVNGILFDKVCKRCHDYVVENDMPPTEEFRTMISGSPFVGAVFFAAANYVGQFNMCSLLSNENRVISTNSLTGALSKITEAQKTACGYVANSHFEISFRNGTNKDEYGWILKMMQGYANDEPRSDILSPNASKWQRFKHGGRKFKRSARKFFSRFS